ncbi:unnamed protein product [Prunus armeniaca]
MQPFSSLLRLKQEHTFKWEEQHQQAFEEIKHYLSNPLVLSPPKRGRPLKLYVSASKVSIGSLLVQDNKEGKEQAVYYLSRTLTEVDRKYSAIERLCLALYFTAMKLRHYMLPYTILIRLIGIKEYELKDKPNLGHTPCQSSFVGHLAVLISATYTGRMRRQP